MQIKKLSRLHFGNFFYISKFLQLWRVWSVHRLLIEHNNSHLQSFFWNPLLRDPFLYFINSLQKLFFFPEIHRSSIWKTKWFLPFKDAQIRGKQRRKNPCIRNFYLIFNCHIPMLTSRQLLISFYTMISAPSF